MDGEKIMIHSVIVILWILVGLLAIDVLWGVDDLIEWGNFQLGIFNEIF